MYLLTVKGSGELLSDTDHELLQNGFPIVLRHVVSQRTRHYEGSKCTRAFLIARPIFRQPFSGFDCSSESFNLRGRFRE